MLNKILWLITARSGSKSIPGKNIKMLGDHPLLSYRITSALQATYDKDVWISTDSEYYAKIAENYGAVVPFIRPFELSTDASSSIDVVLHAMNFAQINNYFYDFIGLLEPTSPFITSQQLDNAITQLIQNQNADAIVAMKENRPNTIFVQNESLYLDLIAKNIQNLKNKNRQFFHKQITPSGGFYISRWDKFLHNKTFYTSQTLSFLVDELTSLEIDEPIDFQFAEFLIQKFALHEKI